MSSLAALAPSGPPVAMDNSSPTASSTVFPEPNLRFKNFPIPLKAGSKMGAVIPPNNAPVSLAFFLSASYLGLLYGASE